MSSANVKKQLIFFDLETSGLDDDAEVLQIGMKYDSSEFNVYIQPTRPIPAEASAINHLTFHDGNLYYKDAKLKAVKRREALICLLDFLKTFENPCVLVAHNCPFDSFYLLRIIIKKNMVSEFREVIDGFTDTLEMLRDKFPDRRSRGQLTLKTLANELSLSTDDAHDAKHDVYLLEKIALHHFNYEQLVGSRKSFSNALRARRR